MGCGASSVMPVGPAVKAARNEKLIDSRSVFHLEGKAMVECEVSPLLKSYDSWHHVLDAEDVEALRGGRAVAVNQLGHHYFALRMEFSILGLTGDSSELKRVVDERRMSKGDHTAETAETTETAETDSSLTSDSPCRSSGRVRVMCKSLSVA